MLHILVLFGLLTYVFFISRSKTLGKWVYCGGMYLERLFAELEKASSDIDGTKVHYYVSKDRSKPHLVLLHGFSADKSIWHRFARFAKRDFTLIIPDLLGHGETAYHVSQSYSAQQQAKMLMRFFDTLAIKHYSVAGNSMGGLIAAQLIEQDAERIQKAILIDPAGAKSDFALAMASSGENPFLHRNMSRFKAFYGRTMAKPPFVPPCVIAYLAQRNYLDRYAEFSHMFRDFFNIEEFFDRPLKNESAKIMLIWGQKDRLLPVADSQMWQQLSGAAPLVYEGIGHMPMVECAKRCYADCRRFLLQ